MRKLMKKARINSLNVILKIFHGKSIKNKKHEKRKKINLDDEICVENKNSFEKNGTSKIERHTKIR